MATLFVAVAAVAVATVCGVCAVCGHRCSCCMWPPLWPLFLAPVFLSAPSASTALTVRAGRLVVSPLLSLCSQNLTIRRLRWWDDLNVCPNVLMFCQSAKMFCLNVLPRCSARFLRRCSAKCSSKRSAKCSASVLPSVLTEIWNIHGPEHITYNILNMCSIPQHNEMRRNVSYHDSTQRFLMR